MNKFFLSLYDFFVDKKKLLISVLIVVMAGLTLSLLNLHYKEDIADFLPNNESNKQISAVYQHIGSSDKLIINFSLSDTALHDEERIMEAIDQFASRLIDKDSLHSIPEIIAQVDETQFLDLIEFIQQNVPYFLNEEDYLRIDSLLQKEDYIASQIAEDKRLLMLPSGSIMRNSVLTDPLHLFSPLLLKLQDFQVGNSQQVKNGYLFSHQGRKGMVIITSPYGVSETAHNSELLVLVNQTIEETNKDFSDLKITCFGAPAIAVTNATQIKNDSILSIALSVILIFALLIYSFRNARNLFLIFFSILFGWLFALGVLAIFKDSISAIALGISSIFIGIAINYPLHFVDHLKHELNRKQALKEIIPPLIIGNITTVGAFLSLAFINSPAMRDLGLLGSLLLIGTIIFVLVFLPHLIRKENGTRNTEYGERNTKSSKWINWFKWFKQREFTRVFTILFCVLTMVFLYLSQFTAFEPDINVINYMTEQQHKDMQDMMQQVEKKGKGIVYFVAEGQSQEEALSTYEHHLPLLDTLKHFGLVESISGIGTFLPSQQEQLQRIANWNNF
ncbi:MAG: MMPL family transporter, partial [Bacteroidales bacterium]|nr:MMPL family transporter [Bacteroidales bacterium]